MSMRRADGVDDQVEAAGELLEGRGVARRVVGAGAEAQAVVLLAQRLRQDGDLRAHRVRDLHRHVAEAAEADDRDLLAGAGAPVAQRRVGGDAGAQQRRCDVELEAVGDAHHEVLVDDDVRRVAAVSHRAVAIDRAVGQRGARQAVLLVALLDSSRTPRTSSPCSRRRPGRPR